MSVSGTGGASAEIRVRCGCQWTLYSGNSDRRRWRSNGMDAHIYRLSRQTVQPSLLEGATNQSFFNNKGQLIKQVDPDGVTTLYEYNDRGEREVVAIDMDRNRTNRL